MSIGEDAIGVDPLAAQNQPTSSATKPPKKRTISAKADSIQQPEAR